MARKKEEHAMTLSQGNCDSCGKRMEKDGVVTVGSEWWCEGCLKKLRTSVDELAEKAALMQQEFDGLAEKAEEIMVVMTARATELKLKVAHQKLELQKCHKAITRRNRRVKLAHEETARQFKTAQFMTEQWDEYRQWIVNLREAGVDVDAEEPDAFGGRPRQAQEIGRGPKRSEVAEPTPQKDRETAGLKQALRMVNEYMVNCDETIARHQAGGVSDVRAIQDRKWGYEYTAMMITARLNYRKSVRPVQPPYMGQDGPEQGGEIPVEPVEEITLDDVTARPFEICTAERCQGLDTHYIHTRKGEVVTIGLHPYHGKVPSEALCNAVAQSPPEVGADLGYEPMKMEGTIPREQLCVDPRCPSAVEHLAHEDYGDLAGTPIKTPLSPDQPLSRYADAQSDLGYDLPAELDPVPEPDLDPIAEETEHGSFQRNDPPPTEAVEGLASPHPAEESARKDRLAEMLTARYGPVESEREDDIHRATVTGLPDGSAVIAHPGEPVQIITPENVAEAVCDDIITRHAARMMEGAARVDEEEESEDDQVAAVHIDEEPETDDPADAETYGEKSTE